jgi:hypothetical protein
MKKIILIVFSIGLMLSSCKEVDKLTQFTMEFDQDATIDATFPIPIGNYNIPTPNITTNSSSTFASNNTSKDLIEQAVLRKMTIEVKSPTDGNFSFLESIKVYIKADGLEEQLIAVNDNVPPDALIELESEGQNLEAYVKKEEIELRVKTVTDEILTQDYEIQIHTEFFIDAKILGL